MAGTITNPTDDRRSLTQAFHEVEEDNGELRQNTPDVNSPVLMWTCPRKWSQIRYAGGRHKTMFVPRTKEEVDEADAPSDGLVEVDMDKPFQPVHGETDPRDWSYPPVVAYNAETEEEIYPVWEETDWSQDIVYFDEDDVSEGDSLILWPILVRGTLQYRGLDQFDHEIAPLDQWSEPIHVFHDFEQHRNESEVHLIGSATFHEAETLALYINSEDEIVWEDEDYPRGNYVSTIEQRVDVTV